MDWQTWGIDLTADGLPKLLVSSVKPNSIKIVWLGLASVRKDYFRILRGKTGVLCGVPAGSGVGLAQPSIVWEACASFGADLALSFQLHDDWLDYWGCSTTTGKPDHADLMANKMTLPLIYLFDPIGCTEQERVVSILQEDRKNGFL